MKFKPYPEYKDSTVEWLGLVPAHWAVESGKYHLQARKQIVGAQHTEFDRLSLTMKGVLPRAKDDAEGLSPESFSTYQILRPDQLVFKMIDLENRATSRVGISHAAGLVSSAYIVAEPIGWVPRFAYYFYFALYNEGIYNVLGSGVRSTLTSGDLRSLRVPVPSSGEQAEIVDFLDGETAEIDAFIADQEELIALLIERRAAAALHVTIGREDAVNRGLLGRFFKKIDRPVIIPGEVVTAFRDGAVTARSNRREEGFTFSASEASYQGVAVGDFVFHGLDGFSGATGVSDSSGNCSPVYHVCAVHEGIDAEYAALYLRALGSSGFLGAYAWSVRQRAVDYRNWGVFSKLPLAFPRFEHQQETIRQFQMAAREIDATIADAREAIALSKERRAALISAVVTGKIDVRNHRGVD